MKELPVKNDSYFYNDNNWSVYYVFCNKYKVRICCILEKCYVHMLNEQYVTVKCMPINSLKFDDADSFVNRYFNLMAFY